MSEIRFNENNNEYLVYYPENLLEKCKANKDKQVLSIYYNFHKKSKVFNVIINDNLNTSDLEKSEVFFLIKEKKEVYFNQDSGRKIIQDLSNKKIFFFAIFDGKGISFYLINEEEKNEQIITLLYKEAYSLKLDIFSRNTGILETDYLIKKTAIISGCGSVGSLVALELARAGIGSFVLIDNDILKYHNICRHQCDIKDVGSYKVDALKKRILSINPFANVEVFNGIAEEMPKEMWDNVAPKDSILIGCADNREADLYLNTIAYIYKVPMVSIGFWERAFAGEIFYILPTNPQMACYECLYNIVSADGVSGRVSKNRRYYTNEENLELVNFEPGISVDISFVTIIGIKIIIDILNLENENYNFKVINDLTQFTLICNTNQIDNEYAEIFSYPLQVTNSIVIQKDPDCGTCQTNEEVHN